MASPKAHLSLHECRELIYAIDEAVGYGDGENITPLIEWIEARFDIGVPRGATGYPDTWLWRKALDDMIAVRSCP